MTLLRSFITIAVFQLLVHTPVLAGDFSWLKELDIKAKMDSSGYQATLSTRFRIGKADINAVISNVDRPADAYMVLRLREMSRHSTVHVLDQYRNYKNKGWGVMAKSLGIKPGSRAFHALKAGHDLHGGGTHYGGTRHVSHGKGNGKGNGKGSGKKR